MQPSNTPFYYGWIIVVFTAMMQIFSIGILFYGIGVAMLPWMQAFDTGRTALAMVPFACTIAISIVSPFAGALFDRYPARRMIAGSLVALALGLFGISLAQSIPQLIIVHATLLTAGAIGAGAFAAQTLTAKWFSRRRGLALALAASGASVGGLLMPYIMSTGIEHYGWRWTYAGIAAFVMLIMVPLALLLVRDAPAILDPVERDVRSESASGLGQPDQPALKTLDILRHPVFLATSLGMASLVAVHLIVQFNLPLMGNAVGRSAASSALLVSLLAGATLCSKPIWGYFIDRSDPRSIYLVLAAIYTYMLIILAEWTGPISYTRLVIGAISCGFASGVMQAFMGVVLARTFGRQNFGRVLGLGHMVMNISCFAPLLSAFFYERTGTYAAASTILLVLLIVMAVLVMRIVSPRRRYAPAPLAGI